MYKISHVGRFDVKSNHTVFEIIERYKRNSNLIPQRTFGHVYAEKATELSGNAVYLDQTEEYLVFLRKSNRISARRFENLLGRH